MKKFVLSAKEKSHIVINEEDLDKGLKECHQSIIGKIVGEKKANFVGVRNYVQSNWGGTSMIKVAEIGTNFFQFTFEDQEEKLKILNGGP